MHRVTKWPRLLIELTIQISGQPCDSKRSAQVVSKCVAAYASWHATLKLFDPQRSLRTACRAKSWQPTYYWTTKIIYPNNASSMAWALFNLCNAVLSFIQTTRRSAATYPSEVIIPPSAFVHFM